MLDEAEFAVVFDLYRNGLRLHKQIEEHLNHVRRGSTIEEIYKPCLEAYERITGFRETNPNAVIHHRLVGFGDPCVTCGKPLRTPRASKCMACGAAKNNKMRSDSIYIDGHQFRSSIEYLSFGGHHEIADMSELSKLRAFPNLKSANFCGTGLDDVGLRYVAEVPTIESLDLQDTKVSNNGLSALVGLHNLRTLRLKDNRQLTNDCIPHLVRLKQLENLAVHETSISQDGVNQLVELVELKDLCVDVWEDNFSFDGLLRLSILMPGCRILAKGQGEFFQGQFRGKWDL